MEQFSIRWQNFRSLKDTSWLRVRPITIVIGANASGKTSIHAPLLLMRQTLDSPDTSLALKIKGDLFDAGSFHGLIFRHDISNILSFSLRHDRYKAKEKDDELKGIGAYPPGEINIQFSLNEETNQVTLQRYHVRDIYGRDLIHRYRLRSGRYSIRQPKLGQVKTKFKSVIQRAHPEHFLFTIEPLIRLRLRAVLEEEGKPEGLTFEEPEALYLHVIGYVAGWIEHLLSSISYIGPIRQHPKRLYEVTGERPADVGVLGQNTPDILFRERKTDLMDLVNEWVSRFEFGFQIRCNDLSPGAYEILLRRQNDGPDISLADTGFGLSQILPLIVQGFYSKKGSLIVAEQPEIHLNPRLQALLADLFVSIARNEKGVFIETHSEHLLLRLRRLVAEGEIDSEDIGLYYVEKSHDVSTIREVPIEKDGHIDQDRWPKGFFGETLSESLALASAQHKRAKHDA